MIDQLRGLKPPVKGSDKVAVSIEIERRYSSCPEMSYIQAVLEFAEEYDYDISVMPKLISPTLKDKIEKEAINANLIKHEDRRQPTLNKWL